MIEPITGLSNPAVKYLRSLRDKKHRRRERRFMAEGLRLLTDARVTGHLPVILAMAASRDPHPLLDTLIGEVAAGGGRVLELSEAALTKVTGKDNPQAVCGVFDEFDTALNRIDRSSSSIVLVTQAMRDPGNLGTMLRTADAVGAGGLVLVDGCADPFSVEAVRASMGAIFTVPLAVAPWSDFREWLRSGPGQLVGASLRNAQEYRGAPYQSPCFVMVGNESRGLPQDLEDECDLRVTIPMHGRADSLNAAIAGAVLSYEAVAVLCRDRG
ncbi:RNA methyltransferase [Croceicoccus sp. F390]|uniref:RNA methyltransferase n=1 Tax=Croceicoccus esteveae TaxID=3075597 RepID=A0ABU2ZG53_9SPHN|nr:RNA methyltransferase [Croceicoccus sp. F390]MDT0575574.1 RNA methyltransferase [Croceicoccus sp. F390]